MQEDIKSQTPYHPAQLEKIFTVMGYPQLADWPDIVKMPGYQKLKEDFDKLVSVHPKAIDRRNFICFSIIFYHMDE
jgi:hypothetical protein